MPVKDIPACTTACVCADVPEAMFVSAHAASNWSDGLTFQQTTSYNQNTLTIIWPTNAHMVTKGILTTAATSTETQLSQKTQWKCQQKQNKRNSYGTSVQNFTPTTPLIRRSLRMRKLSKIARHQLGSRFFCGSHTSRPSRPRQLKDYFLKQLRHVGVPQEQLLHFYTGVIRPVTGICGPSLKSIAHENTNRPTRSNTKANS